MMRVKRFFTLCLAAALALCCAACGETVSLPESLGVNASQGTVQDHWDDHGGMSDGTEYWEIAFSPEDAAEFEESLQTAQGWHALPPDNDVRYLLYGTEGVEETSDGAFLSASPYLTGEDGAPLFPPVEEGYWFFYDEQTESYTAQGVRERPSQNFTAAVYDSQSRTLYCGELDT